MKLRRIILPLILAVMVSPVIPLAAAVDPPDTLTISSVHVFRNAVEQNDQLYIVTGTIDYTVAPGTYTAYDLFLIRLMDGATELGSTAPYAFFDDGFDYFTVGLYFSASDVTTLGMGWGDGTGYSMAIDGNPGIDWSSYPTTSVASFDQWYDGGSVAATTSQLTLRMRTIALVTENTWGVTLTELIAGVRKYNANGEDYFSTSVPNLRLAAPDLFSQSQYTPEFPELGVVSIGYTGGDDANSVIYGTNWASETFTATSSFTIAGVYVKYFRTGTPGNITASLRATAAGVPDGADLATGTLSANSAVTSVGEWDSIIFTTPYALTSGTTYSVIFRCLTGDVNNSVSLRTDSAGSYSGGSLYTSVNSGAAWANTAASDMLFIIYADESHNLTWLQQWEGRLIGTPFDAQPLANLFSIDRMLMGSILAFFVSVGFAFVATRRANNFKVWIGVVALSMAFASVVGLAYAAIGIGMIVVILLGAFYAILKPAR